MLATECWAWVPDKIIRIAKPERISCEREFWENKWAYSSPSNGKGHNDRICWDFQPDNQIPSH